jgi:class 3 adenylate cyclase
VNTVDFEHRLAAILAADAAGCSRLMAIDGQATVAVLDAARAVFRTRIEAQQGRVIDMAGDSVLAVFAAADPRNPARRERRPERRLAGVRQRRPGPGDRARRRIASGRAGRMAVAPGRGAGGGLSYSAAAGSARCGAAGFESTSAPSSMRPWRSVNRSWM